MGTTPSLHADAPSPDPSTVQGLASRLPCALTHTDYDRTRNKASWSSRYVSSCHASQCIIPPQGWAEDNNILCDSSGRERDRQQRKDFEAACKAEAGAVALKHAANPAVSTYIAGGIFYYVFSSQVDVQEYKCHMRALRVLHYLQIPGLMAPLASLATSYGFSIACIAIVALHEWLDPYSTVGQHYHTLVADALQYRVPSLATDDSATAQDNAVLPFDAFHIGDGRVVVTCAVKLLPTTLLRPEFFVGVKLPHKLLLPSDAEMRTYHNNTTLRPTMLFPHLSAVVSSSVGMRTGTRLWSTPILNAIQLLNSECCVLDDTVRSVGAPSTSCHNTCGAAHHVDPLVAQEEGGRPCTHHRAVRARNTAIIATYTFACVDNAVKLLAALPEVSCMELSDELHRAGVSVGAFGIIWDELIQRGQRNRAHTRLLACEMVARAGKRVLVEQLRTVMRSRGALHSEQADALGAKIVGYVFKGILQRPSGPEATKGSSTPAFSALWEANVVPKLRELFGTISHVITADVVVFKPLYERLCLLCGVTFNKGVPVMHRTLRCNPIYFTHTRAEVTALMKVAKTGDRALPLSFPLSAWCGLPSVSQEVADAMEHSVEQRVAAKKPVAPLASLRYAAVVSSLAVYYARRRQYREAGDLLDLLVDPQVAVFPSYSCLAALQLRTVLLAMEVAVKLRQYRRALAIFQRSWAACTALRRTRLDDGTALSLFHMARPIELLYSRLVSCCESLMSGNDPTMRARIGNEAVKSAKQWVLLSGALFSTVSPQHVHACEKLAAAYAKIDAQKEAYDISRRTLRAVRRAYGENHELTATALSSKAYVSSAFGYHREALMLHKAVLSVYKHLYGHRSRQVALTLYNVGAAYLRMAKLTNAVTMFHACSNLCSELEIGPSTGKASLLVGVCSKAMAQVRQEAVVRIQRWFRAERFDTVVSHTLWSASQMGDYTVATMCTTLSSWSSVDSLEGSMCSSVKSEAVGVAA